MMVITDKQIHIKKIYNCSLSEAWKKWTTHEGLRSFFGKDNKLELRIGGPFEIYFLLESPAGQRGSEGCKILSYLPERMLSFSWNAPPHFKVIRNSSYFTWVVLNFRSVSDNQTEIELTHLGWPEGEKWDEVYDYFSKAWQMVMSSLAF